MLSLEKINILQLFIKNYFIKSIKKYTGPAKIA